ncbi:methylated-DNA--[protein]-cysteine S-methyltransferase [Streptococcus suis]
MMLYKQIYTSPLGPISLIASDQGLVGAWFHGQKYFERGVAEEISLTPHPHLDQAARLLAEYFAGKFPGFSQLPLDLRGTDFQMKVWRILQEIPVGQTTSYGQIAKALDIQSGQAIGGAVGRNPLSIIIPCHRVLSSDMKLTGYAGGLDRKIWLLQHENPYFEVRK